MKCLIVVNAYIRNKSQLMQAQRIAEELRLFGADCNTVKNFNLAHIGGGEVTAMEADCCVFLDKDIAAARLLEKSGIRLFNRADAIAVCDDKMLTHTALANCGIAMPDSFYAPLCYYEDAQIDKAYLKTVADGLGFPMVAKKCFGSCGAGVFLVNNIKELYAFENANKLTAHFYQKFIGSGGEDIRVIVIGGKYVCSMKRVNGKDFRSNIEAGGRGENHIADKNLIVLCEKTAKLLNLDYCGIDILTDGQGNRYVCEVNSNAFFAEAERVCGVNIAKAYAAHILGTK